MLRACPPGRHLELLRKNPQGVGIVVALALMIALAPRRPRLATAIATINMAHTFPFLSNHAALWLTALAAGTDSAVCRALLGVGYLAAGIHKLNPDFMHPVTGCMADFGGRFARLADAFGLPTLADAAEASVALVGPPFVAVELLGGLAILLRLKAIALLAFAALHAPTALIVFYDFGSVALAVLWPDLLWFSPRAKREHWYANVLAAIALLPLTSAAPGSPAFLRAQALRAALLVAAALRLWRRGVWFAASRPRGRRRCGVLGLAAAVWLAVQCAGPHIGLNTSGGFSMFSSLRFHPDGRTSHSYLAVPPRWRFGLSADVVRFANATGGRKLHFPGPGPLREGELLPRSELCNIAWWHQLAVTTADGEVIEPGWLPCSSFRFRKFSPDGSAVPRWCEW